MDESAQDGGGPTPPPVRVHQRLHYDGVRTYAEACSCAIGQDHPCLACYASR